MTDDLEPSRRTDSRLSLPNLAVGVLAICAVLVTGLVVRREFFAAVSPPAQQLSATAYPNWRTFASAGHRRGRADATVVVTTFSDFQCPYCRVLAGRLDTLRAEFGEDVAVVHRHLPLRTHPFALDAAKASECAGEQDRFWEFHDALFARQESIGTLEWTAYAAAAGIPDVVGFSRCLAERSEFPGLHRDTVAARQLALDGTPASLVNDQMIQGALPLNVFRDAVRKALRNERP